MKKRCLRIVSMLLVFMMGFPVSMYGNTIKTPTSGTTKYITIGGKLLDNAIKNGVEDIYSAWEFQLFKVNWKGETKQFERVTDYRFEPTDTQQVIVKGQNNAKITVPIKDCIVNQDIGLFIKELNLYMASNNKDSNNSNYKIYKYVSDCVSNKKDTYILFRPQNNNAHIKQYLFTGKDTSNPTEDMLEGKDWGKSVINSFKIKLSKSDKEVENIKLSTYAFYMGKSKNISGELGTYLDTNPNAIRAFITKGYGDGKRTVELSELSKALTILTLEGKEKYGERRIDLQLKESGFIWDAEQEMSIKIVTNKMLENKFGSIEKFKGELAGQTGATQAQALHEKVNAMGFANDFLFDYITIGDPVPAPKMEPKEGSDKENYIIPGYISSMSFDVVFNENITDPKLIRNVKDVKIVINVDKKAETEDVVKPIKYGQVVKIWLVEDGVKKPVGSEKYSVDCIGEKLGVTINFKDKEFVSNKLYKINMLFETSIPNKPTTANESFSYDKYAKFLKKSPDRSPVGITVNGISVLKEGEEGIRSNFEEKTLKLMKYRPIPVVS